MKAIARDERWVTFLFAAGGVGGLMALTPLLIVGRPLGLTYPVFVSDPAFVHRVGLIAAWLTQCLIILIAVAPRRFRALMVPAMAEKVAAVAFGVWLAAAGGHAMPWFWAVLAADAVLGVGFLAAWRATGVTPNPVESPSFIS